MLTVQLCAYQLLSWSRKSVLTSYSLTASKLVKTHCVKHHYPVISIQKHKGFIGISRKHNARPTWVCKTSEYEVREWLPLHQKCWIFAEILHLVLPLTERENKGALTYLISVKNEETNDRRGVENTDFPVFLHPFFCLWLHLTCSLSPSMGLWLIAAVRNNNRGSGGIFLWRTVQTAVWLQDYEVSASDMLAGQGAVTSLERLLHPSCPPDIRNDVTLMTEFMYIVL